MRSCENTAIKCCQRLAQLLGQLGGLLTRWGQVSTLLETLYDGERKCYVFLREGLHFFQVAAGGGPTLTLSRRPLYHSALRIERGRRVCGSGFTAAGPAPRVRKTPSWPRSWANFSL